MVQLSCVAGNIWRRSALSVLRQRRWKWRRRSCAQQQVLGTVACPSMRIFFKLVSLSVCFCLICVCQYGVSLVVEVCVVVESSGREPRRPGRDRQCSRLCSSLDTLLEKAVYIHGLVHEFRLASSIRIVKATPWSGGLGSQAAHSWTMKNGDQQIV